jgi:hypothetical protein
MSKEQTAQKRAELQAQIDTLKFALGNPGANLDPLLTEEGKAALKKLKRMDIEGQIMRAQTTLASL